MNEKYSWDPEKRDQNIKERGLDMVRLADDIFNDPNVVIEQDVRGYGEERYLAYGLVGEKRLCLCFTPRNGKMHLITVYKIHERIWRKHYG